MAGLVNLYIGFFSWHKLSVNLLVLSPVNLYSSVCFWKAVLFSISRFVLIHKEKSVSGWAKIEKLSICGLYNEFIEVDKGISIWIADEEESNGIIKE